MYDVGRRRLIAEAQLQLVEALPHQTVEAVSIEVKKLVVRTGTDQPAGHRLPAFVQRQTTEAFSALLFHGLFTPVKQCGHTHIFVPALTRCTHGFMGARLDDAFSLGLKANVTLLKQLIHVDAGELPEAIGEDDVPGHPVFLNRVPFQAGKLNQAKACQFLKESGQTTRLNPRFRNDVAVFIFRAQLSGQAAAVNGDYRRGHVCALDKQRCDRIDEVSALRPEVAFAACGLTEFHKIGVTGKALAQPPLTGNLVFNNKVTHGMAILARQRAVIFRREPDGFRAFAGNRMFAATPPVFL